MVPRVLRRSLALVLLLSVLPLLAQVRRGQQQEPLTREQQTQQDRARDLAEFVKANYTKSEYRIPVRDGVYLFTAVYVPKDASATNICTKSNDLGTTFTEPADYAGIAAAAGGAKPFTVRHPDEIEAALADAVKTVKEEGRCAVLDVWLPHL